MFIILGATGHVGSAVAETLLKNGHEVTAVTRHENNAQLLRAKGATVAVADLYDMEAMREVFRKGKRLFLLNPPAAPDTDTDQVEKETVRLLLGAIEGSGLQMIVAQSTYGAQPGDELGDLNTLYAMEDGLRGQAIPATILRAAYYFSNWDGMLDAARGGTLPTMFPAELTLPMVAPADLGEVAAGLLTAPIDETGVVHVEGPSRYSARDVADAFSRALKRSVELVVTPRAQWEDAFRKLGFSTEAARSYARMTGITVDGAYDMPEEPRRGTTELQRYIDALAGNE
ncbi:NAD-dependent epimerase/dehydratase family protein [Luteimonas aestuarii]|uniref:NAD-dependent epimerase/dehydratase family protein n=1 Tax=Luteimonas aestuarii TaxID=453837 RepID=A0A4R5TYA1_9GAMM|nr:NmrA family NAD(P)-binding protein [Luteimonas aestuarii]TDK26196.1 NAD-dependent epimerase/dehydratase family protein [Luteimonas aestuarii]